MQLPHLAPSRQIGPYLVVARLDQTGYGAAAVPEHRFIARTPDGERTVVVSTPLDSTDPGRFRTEAQAARFLIGPWAAPVTEYAEPGAAVWCARPYVPALPLPTALAVNGGPLPDETLRVLGRCLAETLAAAHAAGVTHAGVSPAAVLLAGDGPRLTCFGAARTAAEDGIARSGLPGLDPGSLAPEQAAGGRPRPPATSTRWARSSRTRPPATPSPTRTNSHSCCARSSPPASPATPRPAPGRPT